MTKVKLTKIQCDVLVGILLGDACLQAESKGKTFRLRVSQSENHKEYLFHLYDIFKNLTLSPPIRYEFTDKRNLNKKYFRWSFSTTQQACLRFYGQQFYKDNKKIVPKLIHRWLKPMSVAYWYMDDGAQKWKATSLAVRFCTDNFLLEHVQLLQNVLVKTYNLKISLQKKDTNYRIYGSSYSYMSLKGLIYIYLHPSMLYKFPIKTHLVTQI